MGLFAVRFAREGGERVQLELRCVLVKSGRRARAHLSLIVISTERVVGEEGGEG